MISINSDRERSVLRALAAQVLEAAGSSENNAKREEWIRHNGLKEGRPMLLIFPENSWEELVPEPELECRDPFLRQIEWDLRRKVYHKKHFHDDHVLDMVYRFPAVFDERMDWNLDFRRKGDGGVSGAYAVEPSLRDEDDLRRMMSTPHRWEFDDVETERRRELLTGAFGDILPVESFLPFYTGSIIFRLVDLMGMTGMMMDLIDRPDFFHRVMRFMTDEIIANYHRMEEERRITSNNHGGYLPSGSFGYCDFLPTPESNPVALKDVWGFADTQEFTNVSPDMWREFALPYQKEVLALFGPIYYGCCERLDDRLEDVLSIENIRKISVGPWSDPLTASEKIGGKAICCRKPNPSQVINGFDRERTRLELKELIAMGRANGSHLEIVLKDLITCNGHPEHYVQWIDEARSAIGL